jgi:hypothetical protein
VKAQTRLTSQQVSWGRKQQHNAAAVQPASADLHHPALLVVQCMLIVPALHEGFDLVCMQVFQQHSQTL